MQVAVLHSFEIQVAVSQHFQMPVAVLQLFEIQVQNTKYLRYNSQHYKIFEIKFVQIKTDITFFSGMQFYQYTKGVHSSVNS